MARKTTRHRGAGEGTIFHRADGRWEAKVTTADGMRKSFYAKTRQEAQRKLAAAQRALDQGEPLADERQTVATYLRTWLDTLPASSRLKPDTIIRHREFVELQIIPNVGHIKLAKLTPFQVQTMYARLIEEDGLSPTTVNHLHATLHKALGAAQRAGVLARNICELIDAPRARHSEMTVLTAEQVRTLLEAAYRERHADRMFYALALATGMRVSELLGLRWRDIDLAACVISVQSNLKRYTRKHAAAGVRQAFTPSSDSKAEQAIPSALEESEEVDEANTEGAEARGWWLDTPKTRHAKRAIRIPPSVRDLLLTHRAQQDMLRTEMSALWTEHDFVFTNAVGDPVWKSSVYHAFQRFLARLSLPRIRVHDLRHTCATLLLKARVNPKIVSEMLGHSSVAITLDIYSHVLPDMQADATSALTEVLLIQTNVPPILPAP